MVLHRTDFGLCMWFFKDCGGVLLGWHLKRREDDDGSHGGRKGRVLGVVDCAAGGKYFSINFGWPLRGGGGKGQNLNG